MVRRSRYLKAGDVVPSGEPKRHIRADDGRVVLYWDLPEERVFTQEKDSLGNLRIQNGIVQAPQRIWICAVCCKARSGSRICVDCESRISQEGRESEQSIWIAELLREQERRERFPFDTVPLEALFSKQLYQNRFYFDPPKRWGAVQSKALREAEAMIEAALKEAEISEHSGRKISDAAPPLHKRISLPRWNGYRYA